MKASLSFTMQAFIVFILVCCSFECEFGHTLVNLIPTATIARKANYQVLSLLTGSANHLAQTVKLLPLQRLSMRRQKSQTQSHQTERFLGLKCKSCNCEFANLRSYDTHRRHRSAQGSPCSDESNKSEITFSERAGLATGILRQHSLKKLGESFTLTIK